MRRDDPRAVDVLEDRLREWAHWLTSGVCADGYPAVSTLHPNWSPPTPGRTPTLRVAVSGGTRAQATHDAIRTLSIRLQMTLLVVYVKRMARAQQAITLQCACSTVDARVRAAKVALGRALMGG